MIENRKKWKSWVGGVLGAIIAGGAIVLGGIVIGNTAITQTVGLAVAQTATLWNNVVDAAKGDAQSTGILGMGLYLFNGTTFDRARGDITNGVDVDVTRISGSITPADAYANPTTANQMWSLNGIFNGTTWNRSRETTMASMPVTGLQAIAPYMTDTVTNWPFLGDLISGLVVSDASNAAVNITTNTSTVVKASVGKIKLVNVNVIGTTSNVRLFNDATAPCDTGFIMQLPTSGLVTTELSHSFTIGLCALTAGAVAADISILYR